MGGTYAKNKSFETSALKHYQLLIKKNIHFNCFKWIGNWN